MVVLTTASLKLFKRFIHRSLSACGTAMHILPKLTRQHSIPASAPLPEQRRIVAEIEKQFTRLEAGVAALRRVQANLKRYRAAVLKAACEGRLVPTEAELAKVRVQSGSGVPPLKQSRDGSATLSATFETGEALLARILAERRKNWTGRGKYKEPAAPDTTNFRRSPKAGRGRPGTSRFLARRSAIP